MVDNRTGKIDSHQHYWSVDRGDYGWLTPETGILYRDYLPSDLKDELGNCGIDRTIVVQAAPSIEETEFMLGLQSLDDKIVGVVGWLDFELEPRLFAEQFEALRRRPGFVGVRPMIQDLPPDWMRREPVWTNIRYLAERDFPFDLQARLWHLPHIIHLLREIPSWRAVINHLAKPDIEQGELSPWKEQMAEIAAYPNVMCKASGFVSGNPDIKWTKVQILPYLRHILNVFGPRRVMFGSDWPVCLLGSSYAETYEIVQDALPKHWGSEELDAVFGGNVARFYKLDATIGGEGIR